MSMNSIDTAPSDIDVQLMIGSDGIGRTYLVVANPMPWTETIELRWASSWPTDPTPLGKTAELRWELPGPEGPSSPMPPSRSTPPNWRFDLPANSNAAWRFSEPTIAIGEWDHRIQASMQRRLEESLDRLALSLTQLTQFQPLENTPANGSFEAPLQEDPKLPKDWALSLTPAAAWSRQTTLVRSGDFSLNYRTDRRDGSGWLQSPPIELPSDGKISASLWYRIPHGPPPTKLTATTTLLTSEVDRLEWKHRFTGNELTRHGDDWQRIDFPILSDEAVAGTTTTDRSLVRFSIDIEGAGDLWFDDFAAYRVFLDETERRQLRSELFVARRELSQNRPMAAWRLTESPSFLFVTQTAPTLPVATASLPLWSGATASQSSRGDARKPLFDFRRRVR
jgi:hypothetical protein